MTPQSAQSVPQPQLAPEQATGLARRTRNLRSNIIRDMFRIANQPNMISLGGGNPAGESFPTNDMPRLMKLVMNRHSATALQYCDTQGYPPLREALANWLQKQGIPATPENLLVTTGSQNALDLIAKLLIDSGTAVVAEQPTYLGALQAFSIFAPQWQFMLDDTEGPVPMHMAQLLANNAPVRPIMYVMPTFRNPSSFSWSDSRVGEAAAVIRQSGNWVIEDDPYRLLRYEGSTIRPLKSLLPEQTLYLGTLSKVFAPGLRLGYCIAPEPLLPWLVKIKQGADLATGTLSQALATEFIRSGRLDEHLPNMLEIYKSKRNALAAALRHHLPPSFDFNLPAGGMFLWVKGPPDFNSEQFLQEAIRHGVFVIPGTAFFDDAASEALKQEHRRAMRLNFSSPTPEQLPEAASRLGKALTAYLTSTRG